MKSIGKKIAELRKEKSITQEELAGMIGVSAQSVSKWENNTTMPDIMLLPVVAGIFNVTIDELFSFETYKSNRNISPEDAPAAVYEEILDTMWAWANNADHSGQVERTKNLTEHPNSHTGIISQRAGGVYANKDMALTYLIGKRESLRFLESNGAAKLLSTLADINVRKIMKYQLENSGTSYTVSSVSVKCSLNEENAKVALDKMVEYGFTSRQVVDLGTGETLDVYCSYGEHKMSLLVYPIFCLAERLSNFQEYWFGFRN